jgi:hypothetical protein
MAMIGFAGGSQQATWLFSTAADAASQRSKNADKISSNRSASMTAKMLQYVI